ncbi:MAG: OadG family protein [Clostridia bacterium]|nr:OadG family protein [Clostridia bacterium]
MFDILMYGLSVAVVGMATVFLGLVILIGMVKVLEKFVNGEIKSMVQSKIGGSAAPAKDAPAIVIETSNVGDDAVVAAISAAIMSIIEEEVKQNPEKAKNTFVVRSIRRVGGIPAWNRAGREEQVYSRL